MKHVKKEKLSFNHNFLIKNILLLIQGAIVGVGAILPGVSGGVLCVAFGIYEPMMELLTHPKTAVKKHYKTFIPFVIGWVLGFILLAKAIEALFAAYSSIALMLFFGLICGNLPELFKASEKDAPSTSWTSFIISLSVSYLFFHLLENGSEITVAPSFGGFLFCGFLWGLSLIIPGFSSSSILIYFGLFEPMTAGISTLDFSVLIPMMIGIAITALLFARLVDALFKRHYTVTLRAILGFVIASSLKVVPTSFSDHLIFIIAIVCFAIGFVAARMMDKYGNKNNDTTTPSNSEKESL